MLYSRLIIAILFTVSYGLAEVYTDRMRIYIDNAVSDFRIDQRTGFSNDSELNTMMSKIGATKLKQWLPNARPTDRDGDIYLNRYYILFFEKSESSLEDISKKILSVNSVDHVELVTVLRPTYVPNDQRWSQQYGLPLIGADLAYDLWDIENGDIPGQMSNGEMVVAVVDVGLKWDHPDLVENVWQNLGEDADGDGVVLVQNGNTWSFDPGDINNVDDDLDGYVDNFVGWDISFDDNDPMPNGGSFDHGTLVAGCVSASTDNGIGVASIGWSVKVMGINSTDDPQYVGDGYSGILAAGQMGANVINCSWGGFGGGNQSVINSVYNSYGSIVVASAGNGGDDGWTNFDMHNPSGLNHVISVSAIGANDDFGCWATAGTTVDLCAPGESVYTTTASGGYGPASGTSFSSPITAGAVALLWSRFPDADKSWVIDRIVNNTDEFPDMQGECNGESLVGMLGTGRLNIHKALSAGVYPSLYIYDVKQMNDTDGDGVFNPGEQMKVKLIIGNEEGWADAQNVVATISSTDDRLQIIDDTIEFSSSVPAGGSALEFMDYFLLETDQESELGDIPCVVNLRAGLQAPYYEVDVSIDLSLSLDQYGFSYPSSTMNLRSSPVVGDLNGDGNFEIYVGDDDGRFYGFSHDGSPLPNFPVEASDKIRSSPALGDVDNDGHEELVFGSYDRKLYVLNHNGSQDLAYNQAGYIVGNPALIDFDNDNDLEIVFTTQNGNDAGELYAIHHTGDNVQGFPVNIGERMSAGPAVGDLDGDGILEIVICTWGEKIYVYDKFGALKFEKATSKRFNTPATLVDIDNDGDLEIVAGNDDGQLFVLHHDGSELAFFDTGDDIRGGISVADVDDDGSYELLFAGYDDMLHIWKPLSDTELDGWPLDMGSNSVTEPLTADLDNDGDLEIIACKRSGMLFVLHHDGTNYDGFPIELTGNIETTPIVRDIDSDGDFEIFVPTTMGLKAIDIKSALGSRSTWSMHRANSSRTGYASLTFVSVEKDEASIPNNFLVSPNYPNPFNPSTTLDINTNINGNLVVSIFDVSGRVINTLMNNELPAGRHRVSWNGENAIGDIMPTGVYFIKVVSNDKVHLQKVMLIK